MDIIYIHDLRVDTIIGIYAWERENRQTVSLDLEMATDISRAASTQNIDDALNYKAISDRITAFISDSEFLLIEAMAEQVASIVMSEFGVPWLRLRLGKPAAVPTARDVGVIIERGSRPPLEGKNKS
ncbi:MAG: dihydroneopterin aldolase [Pseudomonas sp.]